MYLNKPQSPIYGLSKNQWFLELSYDHSERYNSYSSVKWKNLIVNATVTNLFPVQILEILFFTELSQYACFLKDLNISKIKDFLENSFIIRILYCRLNQTHSKSLPVIDLKEIGLHWKYPFLKSDGE